MKTAKVVATPKGKAVKANGCLIFDANRDVEDILYNAYAEKFQTGKVSDNTWLAKWVDAQLDVELNNLKAHPELADRILFGMNKVVSNTQEYLNSKKEFDVDFAEYKLRDSLSPWQKNVFDDKNKRIALLCGRRAGKTYAVARRAIKHCLGPKLPGNRNRVAIIVGLTLEKTANLYWEIVKEAIENAHIKTKRIDNGNYRVEFSNGNILYLSGNSTKQEREKIRGADFSCIVIDEMQSQAGLYYLMNDIVGPIIKGTDGEIITLGTAPLTAGTMWEEIINNDKYSHYSATMQDNPFIPDYEHALESVLEENHWTKDNITFRREYLAEIAYDTNRMIYPKRTYYDVIPADFKPKKCYIGVDFGWADYSSFAPILVDDKGEGYLIEEWKQNKTAASEIVNKARTLCESIHKKWNIPMEDIHLVADTSHQQISVDIYNQGIYNITNAYKQNEQYQIARVAEALEVGYLHIVEHGYFDQECNKLAWQWNDERGCVVYEIDDKNFHPDIADSVKYAWNQYIAERNASC